MKKISILLLLCGAIFFTACKEKTIAQEVRVLTPQEFKDSIDNNPEIQLLDVRTPEEFAEGHLVDAENIPPDHRSGSCGRRRIWRVVVLHRHPGQRVKTFDT